jgi:hypothetical protein
MNDRPASGVNDGPTSKMNGGPIIYLDPPQLDHKSCDLYLPFIRPYRVLCVMCHRLDSGVTRSSIHSVVVLRRTTPLSGDYLSWKIGYSHLHVSANRKKRVVETDYPPHYLIDI